MLRLEILWGRAEALPPAFQPASPVEKNRRIDLHGRSRGPENAEPKLGGRAEALPHEKPGESSR
jgi:hypothetical protein